MTVSELHIALANSLGDYIIYNPSGSSRLLQLPNGVRYSTALRDSYLTRAMRTIQEKAFKMLVNHTSQDISLILNRVFPIQVILYSTSFGSTVSNISIILPSNMPDFIHCYGLLARPTNISPTNPVSLTPYLTGNIRGLNGTNPNSNEHVISDVSFIPIVDFIGGIARRGGNKLNGISNYAYIRNNKIIDVIIGKWSVRSRLINSIAFDLYYFPVAQDVSTLAPTANVLFEDMYFQDIIRIASLYANADSQQPDAFQTIIALEGVNANYTNQQPGGTQ